MGLPSFCIIALLVTNELTTAIQGWGMNKILWLLAIWQLLRYDIFDFELMIMKKISAIIISNFISLLWQIFMLVKNNFIGYANGKINRL